VCQGKRHNCKPLTLTTAFFIHHFTVENSAHGLPTYPYWPFPLQFAAASGIRRYLRIVVIACRHPERKASGDGALHARSTGRKSGPEGKLYERHTANNRHCRSNRR
jgi:hypothetical protein